MDMTWENETRQHKAIKTTIYKKNIYIYISHSILAVIHCLKPKAQCTNLKVETWQTKPQRAPKLPQFNSSTLSLAILHLCPSSHIPHFFSFTQSSQSLRLCPSPLLCLKPMATTNVSFCVGSSSHTSGGVDVFLIIKIVMLCGIIFIAIFF